MSVKETNFHLSRKDLSINIHHNDYGKQCFEYMKIIEIVDF